MMRCFAAVTPVSHHVIFGILHLDAAAATTSVAATLAATATGAANGKHAGTSLIVSAHNSVAGLAMQTS